MTKSRLPGRASRAVAISLAVASAAAISCGEAPSRPQVPPPTSSVPPPIAASALPARAQLEAGGAIAMDDEAIAKACQAYVDLLVEIHPEQATGLGLHQRDTDLDDRTPWGIERDLGKLEKMLASLDERFRSPRASRTALTDLALLKHMLAVEVRSTREQRPHERRPGFYAQSPMNALFWMLARDYAPAAERARNALARTEKIPAMLALAKQNLKEPPKVWTENGIEQAAAAKSFFDEQRRQLRKMLPGEEARVDDATKKAQAAYADYKRFLEKDVLPRSKGDFAAGKPLFEFLLKESYFLEEDSEALLALGKRMMAKTDEQLAELAKKIDPKAKGWPEVTARLKGNHPTAEKLLDAYRAEVARARKFLAEKDAVEFPPGDDLDVVDTPVFQRTMITAAYDQPPPFDKVTKGLFFVTPVDKTLPKAKQEEMLRESDRGDLVDTAVHEAYPGHHLQLSFARLHPSVIRKVADASIFSEGWGLYSEELMAELGYYTDEERMLQLEWTLVRAARVVIDIGLHTKGMTFDEAVKILTDTVHLEKTLALSEVKRYTEEPTQPLSYLVGREMIFKIRERYKQREGDKYSLKAFHKELLSHGTIPVGLVDKEIFER
jgi:uncharacterized protein (DUF885 family)